MERKQCKVSYFLKTGHLTAAPLTVEEVGVKDSLHDTSDYRNRVECIVDKISIDPIRDVQSSVQSKSEQVMCCDGLGFSCSLNHHQLR